MNDNSIKFGDAFKKFLKEEKLDQTFQERKLVTYWAEIMGEVVANRTLKIFIKEKIMYVTLSSAPLKHQLTTSKDKVIERISEKIGAGIIEDIRFI